MVKYTNSPTLRVRSKTYLMMYRTISPISLDDVKEYFLPENQLHYYIVNFTISDNKQNINTTIVLLILNQAEEIRNSNTLDKLTLNINNQKL